MTRERLEDYIARWIPRLRLDHWDVFVDWEEHPPDGESAHTVWAYSYDHVMLRFSANFENWTERYAETTVVHELLHVVARDLQMAIDASHSLLRGPAQTLADARTEHEMEGVVDRLATVLVALTS